MRSRIIFLIIVLITTWEVSGQTKIRPRDSVSIKNQIEGFYSWYIKIIHNRTLEKEFNPEFVRRSDGMTTLDFTKYKDGLRKYKFTEDFIQRKVNEYNKCLGNLNKIPFDTFAKFQDLDDFENINCDFSNGYEWTGGMEPKDKAELSGLTRVDHRTITGKMDFTSHSKFDGEATITFRKFGKEWRIDDLVLGR